MLPARLLRFPPRRGRLAVALPAAIVIAAAPPAAALSRAMWAEFNTIYLINLKPAAECSPYRTRSIELLKDTSLSPAALDERMHALWNEAKANCLAKPAPEPAARLRADSAATQARPATPATAAPAPAPAVAAAGEPGKPLAAKPPVEKPPVEKPPVAAPVAKPVAPPSTGPVPEVAPPKPAAAAPPPVPRAPSPPAVPVAAPTPPAVPAPTAGSAPPSPASPAPPGPAAAGTITTAGAGNAAADEHPRAPEGRGNPAPGVPMQSTPGTRTPGEGRPAIALPQLKPAIELPQVVDLRLEAACAKRNPYAYQVASDDDPCARLASAKAAKSDPAATGAASPGPRTSAWPWAVAAVALAGLAGGGGWWWRRRRRSRPVAEAADRGDDGAGEGHAGHRQADDATPPEHPRHDEALAPALS